MIDKSDNNDTNTYQSPLPADGYRASSAQKKARGAGFALFIAFLALFFTAAGIAAGYKHWQRMHERAKSNARKIVQLEETLAAKSDSATLEQLRTELQQLSQNHQQKTTSQLQQMNRLHTQTEQFANAVTAQVKQITSLQSGLQQRTSPVSKEAWQTEEVHYLLKLATRELALTGDPTVAQQLLKTADEKLSEIGSLSFMPVRKQIAKDLAALAAIPTADFDAISSQIDQLLADLDRTRAPHKELSKTTPEINHMTADSATEDQTLWDGLQQHAKATLGTLVTVHQLDNPLAASLTMENNQQLHNLLQIRLENLRLMALQKRDAAYHQQIKLLSQTIRSYYTEQQAADWLSLLDSLDHITLQPELPDISGSLQQLENARFSGQRKDQP